MVVGCVLLGIVGTLYKPILTVSDVPPTVAKRALGRHEHVPGSHHDYEVDEHEDNDGNKKVSYHEAVQQPINPPYQEYLNLKAGKASLEVTLRSSVVDDDCNTGSIKKKKRKK